MAMMQVGNVRMIMCQRRMHVRMQMRLYHCTVVLMLMMRIVNVQMLMKYGFVCVAMTVSLSKQDCYSNDHECCAREFRQVGKFAKHDY